MTTCSKCVNISSNFWLKVFCIAAMATKVASHQKKVSTSCSFSCVISQENSEMLWDAFYSLITTIALYFCCPNRQTARLQIQMMFLTICSCPYHLKTKMMHACLQILIKKKLSQVHHRVYTTTGRQRY